MQQHSFIDLFIDLFESALRVSGDKFAHLQEHFWLYMQLWYNNYLIQLIILFLSNYDYSSHVKILFILIYHYSALYQTCIYSQKSSWRWANLPPETCRADSNRSI